MNVSLRHLRAFVAVAKTESFTAAAGILHLTQPSLTKAIRELEEELGLSLFERTTRKVLLTPYGIAFLPSAQQLLNKLDLALKNLQEQANGLRGTIRVAAGAAISTTLLPVVISTFARRYPNITIHLFNDTSGGVMRRVGAGEVDLGIGSYTGSAAAHDVAARYLLSARLGVLFPPGYPVDDALIAENDLKKIPLLRDEGDTSIMSVLHQGSPNLWAAHNYQLVVTDLISQFAMVKAGVGACILSALAASHPLSEDLVYKLIDSTRLRRELYLFSRKNAVPSAALSLFIDVIYEVLPSVYFREGVTIESGLKSEMFM
ncbi:LysR family transcriptional regulator [Aeromonas allosaccharophila]|uniref:LysR family transcriptional regulator n=1 Tax=Aeromonas allosaccharophila TaxID=656 RepID=UPI003987B606